MINSFCRKQFSSTLLSQLSPSYILLCQLLSPYLVNFRPTESTSSILLCQTSFIFLSELPSFSSVNFLHHAQLTSLCCSIHIFFSVRFLHLAQLISFALLSQLTSSFLISFLNLTQSTYFIFLNEPHSSCSISLYSGLDYYQLLSITRVFAVDTRLPESN